MRNQVVRILNNPLGAGDEALKVTSWKTAVHMKKRKSLLYNV